MLLLSSVARGAARVTYAFYPVATYMPQLYEVKRSGKDGFSSTTCLVVVLLSVLRVAFWIIRRVREWSYLVYSITLLLMQFYLLDAVISARRKKQAVPRRHGTTSAALASNLKAVRTWIRGNREAVSALWRTLRLSFWAWDDLAPTSKSWSLFATRDAYSRFVGTCVAVCDVLVAAPQLRKNCVRGDTAGLSTLMVVAWFARDVLFLLNRRVASRQNEQLGALDEGKWRAQVVSSPRIGLAIAAFVGQFRPADDPPHAPRRPGPVRSGSARKHLRLCGPAPQKGSAETDNLDDASERTA
ncbi:hypothetical protein CTAYLR_009591 [Chrysophaeum taylorii]|uniref:Uncharacterized protein n=1 Tax=Chrysophaeum taylorii TaxID=2483200 RepID=A0AAD7UIX5_9STRA|nr:hypothetical protein CTAYLR_009591 [Chrysophaeum taylorii]